MCNSIVIGRSLHSTINNSALCGMLDVYICGMLLYGSLDAHFICIRTIIDDSTMLTDALVGDSIEVYCKVDSKVLPTGPKANICYTEITELPSTTDDYGWLFIILIPLSPDIS